MWGQEPPQPTAGVEEDTIGSLALFAFASLIDALITPSSLGMVDARLKLSGYLVGDQG